MMTSSPSNSPAPEPIALWHWAVPVMLLLVTAPIWLGWAKTELFYFLNRQLAQAPELLWTTCSLFGTGWAIYAVTSPLLLRAPRVFVSWLCAAPLAGVLTRLGKMAANNPRPLEVLDPASVHVIGEPLFIAAMPSGHTMTAFAGAAALYFSLNPARRRPWLGLFVFAAGAGLSRIAVGAHWPADVCVGAAAGVLSGLLGAWIAQRLPASQLKINSWLMRALALLGGYVAYVLLTDPMGFEQNFPVQYALTVFMGFHLFLFAVQSWRAGRSG